jgi:hypothetical protein
MGVNIKKSSAISYKKGIKRVKESVLFPVLRTVKKQEKQNETQDITPLLI